MKTKRATRSRYSARRVQREYAAMLELYGKGDREGARLAFERMRGEVARRTPEQVERMERQQGLLEP